MKKGLSCKIIIFLFWRQIYEKSYIKKAMITRRHMYFIGIEIYKQVT